MAKESLSVSADEEVIEQIKEDPSLSQTDVFQKGWEEMKKEEKGDLEQFKDELENLQEEKQKLRDKLEDVESQIEEVQENIEQLEQAQSAEVTAMIEIQREMFNQGYDYNTRTREDTIPQSVIETRNDMNDETGELILPESIKACYEDVVQDMDDYEPAKVDSWVQNNM